MPSEALEIPANIGQDTELLSRADVSTRQLICLARAIIRRPALLVLDELSATLGTAAHDRIDAVMLGQGVVTVVQASRSLRRLAAATHVCVLKSGSVVEYGKTSELIQDGNSHVGKEVKTWGEEEQVAVR